MWRRGVGLSELFFCIALVSIFLSWPVQARADAYFCERFLQQELGGLGAYLELVKTDKELVLAEQAYAATAGKFFALFADDTQEYIGFFLKEIRRLENKIEGFGRKGYRNIYLERRKVVTAYMGEVLARRDDSALFPLLHALSVLFWADPGVYPGTFHDNPVHFSGDYTKFRTLPGGGKLLKLNEYGFSYEIYSFPDQTWAMIRSPSPRTDFALIRFKDGKISFSTIPGVRAEDFYPSGEAAFALDTPSAKERVVGVQACSMTPVLAVDTSHIPFAVRAELQQNFSAGEISYTCIPECSIPFVWTGTGYRQSEKTCLPQGKWGVFSPFRGNDLARVSDAYDIFVKTDARLAAHEQKFTSMFKAFASLFSDNNQLLLASLQQRQKLQQQIGLQIWVDDQDTFVEMILEQDQPVIDYMELVIELARKPNARLLYALDSLHDAINWISLQEAGFDEYALRSLYPSANVGENYLARLTRVVNLLRDRKTETDDEGFECGSNGSWKGFKSGNTATFKGASYGCDGTSYSTKRFYNLRKAADGALWGESVIDFVESVPGGNSQIVNADRYVTLIKKGKIHLLTPGLLSPESFFQDGEAGLTIMEPSVEEKKQGVEADCALQPALEMDTSRIPFRLKAFLLQTDANALTNRASCKAQCVIPYRWDAAKLSYIQDKAQCLAQGKWGKIMKK